MDRYNSRQLSIAGFLSLGSIIISSFAIAQVKRLYLPVPLALAILNLMIPVLAIATVLVSRRVPRTNYHPILTAIASASSFVPFTILVLSFVYSVPSDILSCTAEQRWLRYFQHHDTAIRSIQDRLQCCGFNSLVDRAWPFPSRDVSANACEITLGYTRRCVEVWMHQESNVAGMIGFTSFLNWILLIILLSNQKGTSWNGLGTIGSVNRRSIAERVPEERITESTYEDEPIRVD